MRANSYLRVCAFIRGQWFVPGFPATHAAGTCGLAPGELADTAFPRILPGLLLFGLAVGSALAGEPPMELGHSRCAGSRAGRRNLAVAMLPRGAWRLRSGSAPGGRWAAAPGSAPLH